MALKSEKKKVDLRSLMQKQRQERSSNAKRVDSPLAKYNSLGQLTCIVCKIPVKSEIIWAAHIQGKKHRQNVEAFKASLTPDEQKISNQSSIQEEKPTLPSSSKIKRKDVEPTEAPIRKKIKVSTVEHLPVKSQPAVRVKVEKNIRQQHQPPVKVKKEEAAAPSMKDVLPEGFFDDPTVDAKVRQVEVKNTAEEEWAKFQKEMEHQQQASQVMLEADETATQVSRNITEIDEQIQRFAKVEKLRDEQDKWKETKLGKPHNKMEESGSSGDEEDYAEFLDWRSKGAFK